MRWTEDGRSGEARTINHEGVQEGRSFHHGQFVHALRQAAIAEPLVTVVEATVQRLVSCPQSGRILGCRAVSKESGDEAVDYLAPLVVVADGCFSKFRRQLLPETSKPIVRSNFVSLLLRDADLPSPGQGHVILPKRDPEASSQEGTGPILVYQLDKHESRMLVDVPGVKLPSIVNGELQASLVLAMQRD